VVVYEASARAGRTRAFGELPVAVAAGEGVAGRWCGCELCMTGQEVDTGWTAVAVLQRPENERPVDVLARHDLAGSAHPGFLVVSGTSCDGVWMLSVSHPAD